MNRKYADKLLVDKNELTEEESSNAALLISLLKIRELQWSVPNLNEIEAIVEFLCTAWSRLSAMYSLEQLSWIAYFIFSFLCQHLYVYYYLYGTNVPV